MADEKAPRAPEASQFEVAREEHQRKLDEALARQRASASQLEAEEQPPSITSFAAAPKAVYGPDDVADLDYLRDLGFPGEYPFTRGIRSDMYRGRLWTMRQYAGYDTVEETNRRFRHLLQQGLAGMNVAFDLPTQLGMDPDHPLAAGEVGKAGISCSSVGQMQTLFEDIPLELYVLGDGAGPRRAP